MIGTFRHIVVHGNVCTPVRKLLGHPTLEVDI